MSDEPVVLPTAAEADLLAGVRSSDLDCLHEIYRRHVDAVLGLALRIGLDRREAEDVCFGIFMSLWDDPDAVVGPDQALEDSLLERVRLVGSTMHAARQSPTGTAGEPSRSAASLDDPRLDAEERRVLDLAVRGTDYREIADVAGHTEDVVRALLTSALLKLSE